MEYITKKVPRQANQSIRELQAEYTLAEGRKITEGEVIMLALEKLSKESKKLKKKNYRLRDLSSSVKGGPMTNSTIEIDEVVYGDVDRT